MRTKTLCAITGALCLVFAACSKLPEMTLEEIEQYSQNLNNQLIQNTRTKPWKGESFKAGNIGGIWYDTILSDPKTFNQLIAQRDGTSASIIGMTLEALSDYDMTAREWKPRAAFYRIETDEGKFIALLPVYDEAEEIELMKRLGDPTSTLCQCLWYLMETKIKRHSVESVTETEFE